MVNSVFEFGDVWKEDKGGMSNGRLKMTDQNIMFKNAKTGKVDQLNSGEVSPSLQAFCIKKMSI